MGTSMPRIQFALGQVVLTVSQVCCDCGRVDTNTVLEGKTITVLQTSPFWSSLVDTLAS